MRARLSASVRKECTWGSVLPATSSLTGSAPVARRRASKATSLPPVNGDGIGLEAQAAIGGEPGIHLRVIVGDVGFQTQHDRSFAAGKGVRAFDQRGQSG